MPIHIKLFNKVLNTGNTSLTEEWLVGLIVPIFKQKVSKLDCDKKYGYNTLSCLGKHLTGILNENLYILLWKKDLLKEIQTGFRNSYHKSDHIFVIKQHVHLFII